MDVSSDHEVPKEDRDMLKSLISLTGLPEDWVKQELGQLLEKTGTDPEKLTLEEIREVLTSYLESLQSVLAQTEPSARVKLNQAD